MRINKRKFQYLAGTFSIVALAFLINRSVASLSPLFLSLLAGLLVGNFFTLSPEARAAIPYLSKTGMRIGIALLGLQITFQNFTDIGLKGFSVILLVVVLTFTTTRFFGVRLGFTPGLSLLMASGFSICGASAVAAVGEAKKNNKDDIAYAVGLVTLLGTLSIFVIPPISKALNLSSSTSGAWIGAAVHDIGQVIATGSIIGPSTLKYAVITKLARVMLLAPLLILLTLGEKRDISKEKSQFKKISRYLPPLFINIFLALVVLDNFGHLTLGLQSFLANVSKFLLSAGLFSMAVGVRLNDLKRIGGKPLVFGLFSWIAFGAISLTTIRIAGI